MAVVKVPQSSTLSLKFQTGVNATGNPVYKTVSYSNTKPAATDADMYAIGQGLGGLQVYPVANIARVDSGNLINQ